MSEKTNQIESLKQKLKDDIYNPFWYKKLSEEEISLLKEKTNFLPKESSFKLRKDYFLNNLTSIQYCKVCGKEIIPSHGKFKEFCSKTCFCSKLGQSILKERRDRTCLEKYGCKCSLRNKDVAEKAKVTLQKKYGCDNAFQSKEIQNKVKKTIKEKYGVENLSQSTDIQSKIKKTIKEKYGVEYVSQSKELRDKAKLTKRKNYYNTFIELLKAKDIIPLFTEDEYKDAKRNQILKFKCLKCGTEFEFDLQERGFETRLIYCPNRIHWASSSKAECEIADWLSSFQLNIKRNEKIKNNNGKKFEADLYLPDYNLAIEYNGLYWHSNLNKDDDYHYNKWKFFKDQNIDCIQIFENEWRDKKDIVKSIITNRLGLNNRIYGRKCIVKEIKNDDYMLFLESNHLQGYCNAKVRLGLYYNDELVMVMSFSKPRFNKKYDWENIRTCFKVGYNIVGGFCKLLKHFKENYSGSIVSYIDSRYFSGNGYINSGFNHIGHSKPNYFYFNNDTLYNRVEFQKHKLKDKLNSFDKNLTEKENMMNNGWNWIYDCGNEIVVYK